MTPDRQQSPWYKEPTKDQWAAFFAAWSGWVLDAFDFTIYLLAAPYIAKEFGVSTTVAMGSVTLTLVLRLAGGYVAGAAADRWGRKLPLMLSILWFALCDGAVAFAPSFGWILVLRALFGLGMGAEWTAGTTMAMENWPERSKGIASGVLQGSWAVGFLLAGVVSGYVIPLYGWRWLFMIAAAPAILVFPIRMWVKESDEWRGEAEARKASGKSGLSELLQPEILRGLLWGTGVMALGFGVYYGMVSPYATMLKAEHGLGPAEIGDLVVLINLGMLLGATVTGTVAKRWGVRWAIVVPSLLMLPALPLYIGQVAGGLEVGAFMGGMFGIGFCGVVPLMLTSLFPAGVRARGVGLVYHAGAFLAAFVPPAVPWLAERFGVSMSISLAGVTGICLLLLAASMLRLGGEAEVVSTNVRAVEAH